MMSTETALSTDQAQHTIADPATLPALPQEGGDVIVPAFSRPKVVTFSHLAQKLEKYISPADMKRIWKPSVLPTKSIWDRFASPASPISPIRWQSPKSAPTGNSMHRPSWQLFCMMWSRIKGLRWKN